MQTLLSIFGCLLLSFLTDKLQSCLSSVCWPEAVSAPSCQSGRLRSSDRLLAAIRWLVSHSFLSYTLKILQTSSNIRAGIQMSACQVPNVGKFFPSMSQCQAVHLPHKRRTEEGKNRLLCTNCLLLVLFDSWAHFHKQTDPLNKMNIITNLKKADKGKQSNNVRQNYIINANLFDLLQFFPLPLDVRLLLGTSYSEAMLEHSISTLSSPNTFCGCTTEGK